MASACLEITAPARTLDLHLEILDEPLTVRVSSGAAAEMVLQIGAALGALRYLAEPAPDGRRGCIRRLPPDGTIGPPLIRYRTRPGEVVRLLQPRVRDPAALVAALTRELLLAERYGCPPALDEIALDLVDATDPGYAIPVIGLLRQVEIR